MPFQKGRKKTGGRKPGVRNQLTTDVRGTIDRLFFEEDLFGTVKDLLESKDKRIQLECVKLLLAYKYGKPVQPVVDEDPAPPMVINISAIPKKRELA